MAITTTDVQGTKVYIAASGTDVSDATKIATAITSAKQIGCIQDLGAVETTREVKEYSCISSNDLTKSLGSIKAGSINIDTLFNALDTAGQKDLRDAYAANESRVFILELTDGGTTPTYITFDGKVSGISTPFAKDEAVQMNFTVEISSNPVFTDATA